MKKTTIFLFVFLAVIAVTSLQAKEDTEKEVSLKPLSKDVLTAGTCSLLFPGGGQLYNRKWLKATFIFTMESAGIYYTYKLFREDSYYKEDMAWFLSFFVIYSVVDAIVDAQFKHIDIRIEK